VWEGGFNRQVLLTIFARYALGLGSTLGDQIESSEFFEVGNRENGLVV